MPRHVRTLQAHINVAGRRAMSLLEVLVTVFVLAVVASMVLPMFTDDAALRAKAAAVILASDLELAQTMNIAAPTDPVIVRFNSEKNCYWLAYAFDPDTPLPRATNGEPYLVEFGKDRARSAFNVSIALDQVDDDTIEFDSSGALKSFNATPHIELSAGEHAITITVSPMTGSILQHTGTIADLNRNQGQGDDGK